MKYNLLSFFLLVALQVLSQNNAIGLQYRSCTDCSNSLNSLSVSSSLKNYSNTITDWMLEDISSDFGKRRVSSGNRFHNGVDIIDKDIGPGQLGDAIISPEDGVVSYMGRYDGNNYRVIVVDGQNHDFGYGHIFVSGMLNNLPYRVGNFVYAQAEPIPNEVQAPFVIINLNTCDALAEQSGRMVVIPNLINCSDTLYTTDTVTAGMEIAPIGKSGTNPVHIHLYRLRNATNPPSALGRGVTWNSGYDPFTVLHNPVNTYDVNVALNKDIDPVGFSNWGGGVLKHGTSENTLALRGTMVGAVPLVNSGGVTINWRYVNDVFVLDKAHIRIAEKNSQDFTSIEGPYFKSEFNIGALQSTSHYPEKMRLPAFGQVGVTNVAPFAYFEDFNNVRAYNNYYYADFRTRMHVNDVGGDSIGSGNRAIANAPIKYALAPDDARYKDGLHLIQGKVNTIDGNSFTSTPFEVAIDNFKPYVKSLTASISGTVIYDFHWETVDGELEPRGGIAQNLPDSGRLDAFALGLGMIVEVEMSEQMESLSLDLSRLVPNCSDDPLILSSDVQPTTDRKNWTFWFSDLSACPFGAGQIDPTGGPWRFIFEGRDFGPDGLAGSNLLGFHEMYDAVTDGNGNSALRVPLDHRISTSAPEWSNTGHADLVEGVDSTHYFRFACSSGNFWDPNSDQDDDIVRRPPEGALEFICCESFEEPMVSIANHSLEGDCSGRISLFAGENAPETSYTISNEIDILDSGVINNEPNGSIDLCPGEYFVELINEFGCVYRDTITIEQCDSLVVNEELLLRSIRPPSRCDSEDGSIYFRFGSPFEDIPSSASIVLQDSEGNEIISEFGIYKGLSNGNYVFLIDNNGCLYEYSFTIGADSFIEISFTADNPCTGDNTGTIELVLNTDSPSYYIEWEDGSEEEIRTNLSSGTYCVTVTTETGCSNSECYTLENISSEIDLSVETYYCPSSLGEISLSVHSGGYGPSSQYFYRWSNGSTQSSQTGLFGDREYCVTVTGDCGQYLEECIYIESREVPPINFAATIRNTCLDEDQAEGSISISNVEGGEGGPYRYTWSNGETSSSIRELAGGEYCVTVTDSEGCVSKSRCYTVEADDGVFLTLNDISHCVMGDCSEALIEVGAVNVNNIPVDAMYSWFAYSSDGQSYESGFGNSITNIPFAGKYTFQASVLGAHCESPTLTVNIYDDCEKVMKDLPIPNYQEDDNHQAFPSSPLFPNGRISLEPIITGLTYSWFGPSETLLSNQPYLAESLSEGPGSYTLLVSNGCQEEAFKYRIDECSSNAGLNIINVCADCISSGYGDLEFSLVNANPSAQYYITDGNTTLSIPIEANDGRSLIFTQITAATNSTIELILFDDSFCAVEEIVEFMPSSARLVRAPFMNFTNDNPVLPGTALPFSCDVAYFCVSGGDDLVTECGQSGTRFVDIIHGPRIPLNTVSVGGKCQVNFECEGGVGAMQGDIQESDGFDGTYCYRGEGCLMTGQAYSPTYNAVYNASNGYSEDHPLYRDLNFPIPVAAFYSQQSNRYQPQTTVEYLPADNNFCVTRYFCGGDEVASFQQTIFSQELPLTPQSLLAYQEFHGTNPPVNTTGFYYEACGSETLAMIPVTSCRQCPKKFFKSIKPTTSSSQFNP